MGAVLHTAAPTRAGLLALAAAVLGLAAHGEAGGTVHLSATTLVVGLGVVLATARLSTVPPRPLRTAAVLAAGQLAMHLAQGHALPGLDAGHAMPATAMPGMTMPGMATGSAAADLGMIGAHLTVAAVVAAGVVQADRGLARAARHAAVRVVSALARLVGGPEPVAPTVVVGTAHGSPAVVPVAALLTRIHPRRGPPSGPGTPTSIPHGRTPPCPLPGRRAPSPA